MDIRLDGKRALVTGANSGIGKAIALALADAGADVAINYIANPDEAKKVTNTIQSKGCKSLAIKADISDPDQVEKMFDTINGEWNGLDILVNNAGIDGERAVAWEMEVENWQKVLHINLFGPFYCARKALQGMIKQKSGAILNVTSVHERIPWHGYSHYTASKAGLSMLTETLAQEAGPYGVRVMAVAPGAVKTAINKPVWTDPEKKKDLLNKIPFNRLGEADDIARAAVFLVSDEASYVTGSSLFVDGGMILYPSFEHGG